MKSDHDGDETTPDQGGMDRDPSGITVVAMENGLILGVATDVEPGQIVYLTLKGENENGEALSREIKAVVTDLFGNYEAEFPSEFSDGFIKVTAEAIDRNGKPLTATADKVVSPSEPCPAGPGDDMCSLEPPTDGGLNRVPGAITVDVIADGSIVGTTTDVKPGNEVTLTITGQDKAGNPIEKKITAEVGADGKYTATVPVDFADGELTVVAIAKDRNGKVVDDQDAAELDRLPSDITVTIDLATEQFTGTTKDVTPKSTVTLKITGIDKDGNALTETITTTTDAQGNYVAPIDAKFVDGDLSVVATVADRNGKEIDDQDAAVLDRTEGDITVDVVENGDITGTTEDVKAGDKVTLTITGQDEAGEPLNKVITAEVGADGKYTATVPAEFADGELTVVATAKDRNGRDLKATDTLIKTDHDNDPNTPDEGGLNRHESDITVTIDLATEQFTGTTKDVTPKSTVTLKITGIDKDGNALTETITTTTDAQGNYVAPIDAKFVDGDLSVVATVADRNGKEIDDQDAAVLDRTEGKITVDVDEKGIITGTTQDVAPGSEVTLTITGKDDTAENISRTITVKTDVNGNYTSVVPRDFADGDLDVIAKATDRNGNDLEAADKLRVPGSIEVEIDLSNNLFIGKSFGLTPNSTVNLEIIGKYNDGREFREIVPVVVDAKGDYSLAIPGELADGAITVNATAVDREGQPVADTANANLNRIDGDISLEIDVENGVFTGETKDVEPGSKVALTITVTDKDGNTFVLDGVEGVPVQTDGTYQVTIPDELKNLDYTVEAKATDRNGKVVTDKKGMSSSPLTKIGTNDNDELTASAGDDIIAGDMGGLQTSFTKGNNYNLSFVVDLSGSMLGGLSRHDSTKRLTLVKEGLTSLVQQLVDHDGKINLQIATFKGDYGYSKEFNGIGRDNLNDIINYISSLNTNSSYNTQPAKGFEKANAWFKNVSQEGFENQTYFLSDGNPSLRDVNDYSEIDNEFKPLAAQSKVYAIGVSDDMNINFLRKYDNTDVNGNLLPGDWDGYYNHGEALQFTKGDELVSYLISGSEIHTNVDVGSDVVSGGAGDDILFGDAINPTWLGGAYAEYVGYPAVISYLREKITNGAEPTQEQTYNFGVSGISG